MRDDPDKYTEKGKTAVQGKTYDKIGQGANNVVNGMKDIIDRPRS